MEQRLASISPDLESEQRKSNQLALQISELRDGLEAFKAKSDQVCFSYLLIPSDCNVIARKNRTTRNGKRVVKEDVGADECY